MCAGVFHARATYFTKPERDDCIFTLRWFIINLRAHCLSDITQIYEINEREKWFCFVCNICLRWYTVEQDFFFVHQVYEFEITSCIFLAYIDVTV